VLVVGLLLASFLVGCSPAATPGTAAPVKETVVVKETVEVPVSSAEQEWELVVPAGVREITPIELAPRITTLEGKTIVLRWNGKHNGDNFLNRIAELLAEKVPSAKVVKLWEVAPETIGSINTADGLAKMVQAAQEYKPDIVIASQAD